MAKKLNASQMRILASLDLVAERAKRAKMTIKRRMEQKYYNVTEQQRLARKVKSMRKNVSDIEFI